MKLTFGTYKEPDKVLVTDFSTYKECWDAIDKYLEEKHYRSDGYMRIVGLEDHKVMIDFGSWHEFFFIDASYEEFENLRNEDAKLRGDDPTRGRQL